MKELGNLAVVCAGRMDVLLQIYDGYACVYVGEGPERAHTCSITVSFPNRSPIRFGYSLIYLSVLLQKPIPTVR